MIDDTIYLFGASLKDAGKKLFAFIEMQETKPSEILSIFIKSCCKASISSAKER